MKLDSKVCADRRIRGDHTLIDKKMLQIRNS
jgi:hypothetical protein